MVDHFTREQGIGCVFPIVEIISSLASCRSFLSYCPFLLSFSALPHSRGFRLLLYLPSTLLPFCPSFLSSRSQRNHIRPLLEHTIWNVITFCFRGYCVLGEEIVVNGRLRTFLGIPRGTYLEQLSISIGDRLTLPLLSKMESTFMILVFTGIPLRFSSNRGSRLEQFDY